MKPGELLSLILALSMAGQLNAWHGTGHYTVAYIAQTHLLKNNPDAFKWANDLLLPYTEVCGENLYPFVEAATWPDKIKDQGWNTYYTSHFMENYFFVDMSPVFIDPCNYNNAVFAISDCIATLSSKKFDPFGSSRSIMGKSISLRNLIHFVGDLHQPLHAGGRANPQNPGGDAGGNFFPIKHYNNPQMDNLHFIWDDMFQPREIDFRSNLNKDQYKVVSTFGDSVMAAYPIQTLEAALSQYPTPARWSDESFNIVQNFVYNGPVENQDLPQSYQDQARILCMNRIALAGYRLGKLLASIYRTFNGNDITAEKEVKDMLQDYEALIAKKRKD